MTEYLRNQNSPFKHHVAYLIAAMSCNQALSYDARLVPPRLLCGEAALLQASSLSFLESLLAVELCDRVRRQASLPGPLGGMAYRPPDRVSLGNRFVSTYCNLQPRIRNLALELGVVLPDVLSDWDDACLIGSELEGPGVKCCSGTVAFTPAARNEFLASPWRWDRDEQSLFSQNALSASTTAGNKLCGRIQRGCDMLAATRLHSESLALDQKRLLVCRWSWVRIVLDKHASVCQGLPSKLVVHHSSSAEAWHC